MDEEVELSRPAVIVHYEPTYQLKPSEDTRYCHALLVLWIPWLCLNFEKLATPGVCDVTVLLSSCCTRY